MNNTHILNITNDWETSLSQSIYIAEKISQGNYETQDLENLLVILEDLKLKIKNTKELSQTKGIR